MKAAASATWRLAALACVVLARGVRADHADYSALVFLVVLLYGVLPLVALLLLVWMVGCCVRGRMVTCCWCCQPTVESASCDLCLPSRKPACLRFGTGLFVLLAAVMSLSALFVSWSDSRYTNVCDPASDDGYNGRWEWRRLNLYDMDSSCSMDVQLHLTHISFSTWSSGDLRYSYDMQLQSDVKEWPCAEHGVPVKPSYPPRSTYCMYVGGDDEDCVETCDAYGLQYNDDTGTLLWQDECNSTDVYSDARRNCDRASSGINAYHGVFDERPPALNSSLGVGCHVATFEDYYWTPKGTFYGTVPCDAPSESMATEKGPGQHRVCLCGKPMSQAPSYSNDFYDLCQHPAVRSRNYCNMHTTGCKSAGRAALGLVIVALVVVAAGLVLLFRDTRASAMRRVEMPLRDDHDHENEHEHVSHNVRPRFRLLAVLGVACVLLVAAAWRWSVGCRDSVNNMPLAGTDNMYVHLSEGWQLVLSSVASLAVAMLVFFLAGRGSCQPPPSRQVAAHGDEPEVQRELAVLREKIVHLEQQQQRVASGQQGEEEGQPQHFVTGAPAQQQQGEGQS